MAELNRGGELNSLGHIDTTQKTFRQQIDTLTDAVRQLGGKAEIEPGAGAVNDPLNAPFVLYVDAIRGRDTFVSGDYSTADDGTFEQKMKRISLQRLECGYTSAAPFRTLNRAVLEAGIITSRDYLNIDPAPCGDLVSIVVEAGVHTIINGPGEGTASVSTWADGYEPDDAELQKFNPAIYGGLILPRGCSVISLDLRKTIIRPGYVPVPADDTVENRRCIFRTTSGGYYYGLTFMDQLDSTTSHHLLSCFEYSSKAQLDDFYSKIRNAFSGVAGIDDSYATTRNSEWEIVGNFPPANPPATSDTVRGSSPYIYNCSIRSVYGICGLYADGSANSGLSSTVLAQFTGVSLQRDMTCFQVYSGGSWRTLGAGEFETYRDTRPDDVRMVPERRSFHIRATNDAVIQEVSVFAIGTGIHHWCESGAEITITNSNSNFGGCSSLAQGYASEALNADIDWSVGTIQVATDMSGESNNIRRVGIGLIDDSVANNATTILLSQPLAESDSIKGVPDVIAEGGYTLREDSYIWVENPAGADYFAPLAADAWDPANPSQIVIKSPFINEDGESPSGTNALPDIKNKRLYIRRLTDIRSVEERQWSLFVNTTSNSRTPIRDYVLQTDPTAAAINTLIPDSAIVTVAKTAKKPARTGVQATAQIELRRNNPRNIWTSGVYYRKGDVIQYQNKHWIAVEDHGSGTSFDPLLWDENYVHMEEDYKPEDFYKNAQPLVIFDNDTDPSEASTDLGWFRSGTNWDDNALLQAQYRTATDYKGMHSFLMSLGFSASESHTILLPKPADQRDRDPAVALDGIGNPTGAANRWANWPIDFRRPSGLRLFGQAWEYTGWSNYTKALPKYQGELSEANKFTYYFTNQDGGRVYPSGFNEEGFAVSSRGLENVETGEILTPEQISSSDQEIIDPPTFDTPADTKTQGLVKIATAEQINQALNNLAVDGDQRFSAVVKVEDFLLVREEILESINLLSDPNTIYYVAANPSDVPDADVRVDASDLNDSRSLSERRAATVCSSVPDAFNRIANRNSVSNRPITIRLYTSTTSASSAYYGGTSQILIVNRMTERTLSEQHEMSGMQFGAESTLKMIQANLLFARSGLDGRLMTDITIYGGRYELNTTTRGAYHVLMFCPLARLNLRFSYGSTPVDTAFICAGDSDAAYKNDGCIIKDLNIDTRHGDAANPPTLEIVCSHTGWAAQYDAFRLSGAVSWYSAPGVGGSPHNYILKVTMSGDNNQFYVMSPQSGARNPIINTYQVNGNITTDFSFNAALDVFGFIYFPFNPITAAVATGAGSMIAEICAAAVSEGVSADSSYYYWGGAATVVNNEFKPDGEKYTVNGPVVPASVFSPIDPTELFMDD